MNKNSTKLIPLGIFALITLLYLLLPLTSEKFKIKAAVQKMAFKEVFLASGNNVIDTIKKPNIVVILADDLGKTDISLYGSPYLTTPHIDAIGKEGVIFSEGYVTAPICSPSRAGLLTGRYQQRFGYEYQPHERYPQNRLELWFFKHIINTGDWLVADQNQFPRKSDQILQGLPPTEFTIAELLKKEGYQTGIFGKWHLGAHEQNIPINLGFDYHYGFYEAFTLYDDPNAENLINQQHTDFSNDHIWGKGRSGTCAIRKNHQVIQETEFLTDKITEEAIQFMTANKDRPFFTYIPYLTPHTPFQITKDYFDKFAHIKDRNKRVYYAMIASLDDAVGKIIATIKSLNLEENTIVFFLSDNGGATYTKATDNAPLKGGKFTNFEGGLNVPFMMKWPSRIPKGKIFSKPVISLDVFATTMAVANVNLPKDRVYDGVNLLPFLQEDNTDNPHEALYWRSRNHKAIRKGNWKLVMDEMSGNKALYQLSTDKIEAIDAQQQQPEIVQDLENTYNQWAQTLMPPLWPRVMDYRIRDKDKLYYFPL